MANFIIRLELDGYDGKPSGVYEELHKKMAAAGFAQTIKASNQKTYHLPTGTYHYSGNTTAGEVLKKAKSAAKEVWAKPILFVGLYTQGSMELNEVISRASFLGG